MVSEYCLTSLHSATHWTALWKKNVINKHRQTVIWRQMFRKHIKRWKAGYFQAKVSEYRTTDLILHNATQFRLHSVTYKTPEHILWVMGAGCCCFIDRQFWTSIFRRTFLRRRPSIAKSWDYYKKDNPSEML